MRYITLVTLTIAAAVLLTGSAVERANAPLLIKETRITTDPAFQSSPVIQGDMIVWIDYRNGNGDVYGYNLTSKHEIAICTDPGMQWAPVVYGNIVAWFNGTSPTTIYECDLRTMIRTRICLGAKSPTTPAMYGDMYLYMDYRDIVHWNNGDIYMYNLTSGVETQITTDLNPQWTPDAYEDIIVWADNRNSNLDIYMYNLTSHVESQITTNIANQTSPSVSGDYVIYSDDRNGRYDIYAYNLRSAAETRITTSSTVTCERPSLDGNLIVWTDDRSGIIQDIYMYDLSSGTETPVCTNSAMQRYADICGNRIVWTDERNDSGDIYLGEVITPPPWDVNQDGKCDIEDLALVARYYGQTVPPAPSNYDLVPDSRIDILDLALMAMHYGETYI